MNYQSGQQGTDSRLIANIIKAINGEYTAIYCYEQLANQTQNSDVKKQILEIRNDEIRHYHGFAEIYTSLTGYQPSPKLTNQCPPDFRSGVIAAFKDEQDTVDFYHEVARETSNLFIKEQFQQASFDEQNHAVWFLFFMNHS